MGYVENKLRGGLACAIALVAACLFISACGASSVHSSAASTSPGAPGNEPPGTTTPTAQLHNRLAGRDVVSGGVVKQRPMRGTGGNEVNDDNPSQADSGTASSGTTSAAGQINPCTFVSKTDAQTIIGKPIAAPQEAPLGPTCIYQPTDASASVTLAVESIDFAKLRPLIRKQVRVTVAGYTAYCGDYGRPTTFVPLSRGRVLNVTAPCSVGVRLAEKALPGLKRYS